MATQNEQQFHPFPPQTQPQQPGVEYVMRPLPQSIDPNYKPCNKLHGKVALVTGGDSGIGRAVCYHFALEGAIVAFTYVDGIEDIDKDETMKTLLKLKTSEAKDPIAIPTDLTLEENCKKVVDQVAEEFGRIDILVNGAAVQHYTYSVEKNSTEDWLDRLFKTNIYSQIFLVKHSLKHMKEGSSIINVASSVAYTGHSGLLDYSCTKGAIVTFTRSLALQLMSREIRVNAVAPGPIWTPLEPASLPVEEVVMLGSQVPMLRAGQPREVAPSFVFLASNLCSSYFTGQVLHPNGGVIVNG